MSVSKTVVIGCAGMGKRLGIGTTKCLVDIAGEPLIIRNLKMLDGIDDVRVVVGFQAEKVIDVVTSYRKDVTFVFNHDYARTNTGESVVLGSKYANDYILTIDGDLLVHPDDMRKILGEVGEFVGVTAPGTDNPVLSDVEGGMVTGFSYEHGSFEWTGITQVRSDKLLTGAGHVYQLIEPFLPMRYVYLRTKEIDTPHDYENAVKWVKAGYSDEVVLGIVGGMGSYATVDFFKRIVDKFPVRYEWERPRILIDNYCTMPSRVRAVIYKEKHDELVRMLADSVQNLMRGGATHVFLACNTSHVFLDQVCALVPDASSYVINMIDLLARDVKALSIEHAFLLASEGTIDTGIYQKEFACYGIDIEPADANLQEKLRYFIEVVKQNKVNKKAADEFADFVKSLGKQNVVLGCTELPILAEATTMPKEVALFDPLQSAIDYIAAEVKKSK